MCLLQKCVSTPKPKNALKLRHPELKLKPEHWQWYTSFKPVFCLQAIAVCLSAQHESGYQNLINVFQSNG